MYYFYMYMKVSWHQYILIYTVSMTSQDFFASQVNDVPQRVSIWAIFKPNSLVLTLEKTLHIAAYFRVSAQPRHTSEAGLNNWYFRGMKRAKFGRQRSDGYNSNRLIQNASLCLWQFIWVCWTGSSRLHRELRKMDACDSGLSVGRPITFPLAFIIHLACLFSATLGLHIWICLI